jgi:hypothetical protein
LLCANAEPLAMVTAKAAAATVLELKSDVFIKILC